MSKFLEISQLVKTFPTPKGPLTIVRDFDLGMKKGEFITLIGHSGCGKSTVLSMIAGLSDVTSGVIVPVPTEAWCFKRPACCRGSPRLKT
jgi:ABC-type Fe3+/spermidine/putrescine transport system ATPase subunit